MTRSRRHLLMLLAGVAVLIVLALWQWRHDQAAAPGRLLKLSPTAVTRITIARQGQPERHFTKRGGHWYRVSGDTRKAADDQRLQALAALAATPVLQWRKASDFDLARIGLAKPPLIVQLNDQRLAYGALTAFGPQRFVRVGERIAVIPASYSPRSSPSPPPQDGPHSTPQPDASSRSSSDSMPSSQKS